MSIQITHVRLSAGGTRHEHITDLQWVQGRDGSTGSSTKLDLINWIAKGEGRAFVGSAPSKVAVGVVNRPGTQRYLRTCANDEWTDNLLSLPRF